MVEQRIISFFFSPQCCSLVHGQWTSARAHQNSETGAPENGSPDKDFKMGAQDWSAAWRARPQKTKLRRSCARARTLAAIFKKLQHKTSNGLFMAFLEAEAVQDKTRGMTFQTFWL